MIEYAVNTSATLNTDDQADPLTLQHQIDVAVFSFYENAGRPEFWARP